MDTTVPAADPGAEVPFPTVLEVFVGGAAGAPGGGVEEGLHPLPQMIWLITLATVLSWPDVGSITVLTDEVEVAETLLQLDAPPQPVGTSAPALI